MKIRTIKDKNFKNKRIILRADFDVPLDGDLVVDDFRIQKQLPTIKLLQKNKNKIILISHLGRPDPEKKESKYSLKPIQKKLEQALHCKIALGPKKFDFKVGTMASKMQPGDILLLENLRYNAGELNNDYNFAKFLAFLGEIYVNNAFAVSHRKHASMSVIKRFLPAYAGLLIEEEIINFNKIKKPKKPLVVLIGGSKLETKVKVIQKFINIAEHILIGGATANNFIAAQNFEIGRSLADKDSIKQAKNILKSDKKHSLVLPLDAIVSSKANKWEPELKKIKQISKTDYIFDIGPETVKLYAKFIKSAQTIVWNGPMGRFEDKPYAHGTLILAKAIAARSRGRAFGAVGGGETIEALKKTQMIEYVDWVSTGGGAMLAYLGGEKLPGLSKIAV